jgi:hypothetical protein
MNPFRFTARIAVLTVLAVASTGCVTMSEAQKNKLHEIRGYGLKDDEIKQKDGTTAGLLNILPGVGNFYLAVGSDEHSQWLFGVGNLLLWPISIAWGVPEGFADAKIMNQKATIDYYTYDPKGIAALDAARARGTPAVAQR